jgi:metallo-beta-lactamase family protein
MSPGVSIKHLGAEKGVTGSCHLLQAKNLNILIDCGIAQGRDSIIPIKDWPVKPQELDFLFLTHAHIDHIGRLPELIQNGFNGEIITTHPTKALLGPMLKDAMSFACLTAREIVDLEQTIQDLTWGFEYNDTFDLKNGIKFTLGRAGHIMGSCFIRIEMSSPDWSVIFSGDLGGYDTPILCDPEIPEPADYLVLESTYGDRIHEDRTQRIKRLELLINRALSDRGKIFIPAFALGRTQELIYEMDRLFSNQKSRPPVFLDSPLGIKITEIYSDLSEYWDKEAKELLSNGNHPIDFNHLYAVEDYRDHLRLINMSDSAVIIAGSGMCSGGRIIDHLKVGLKNPANDLFFAGYQAKGTPGRDIIKYSKMPHGYIQLEGKRIEINAKVHNLTGYSAHADQQGLLDWVESIAQKPGEIKLVHGEYHARKTLKDLLENKGHNVVNSM